MCTGISLYVYMSIYTYMCIHEIPDGHCLFGGAIGRPQASLPPTVAPDASFLSVSTTHCRALQRCNAPKQVVAHFNAVLHVCMYVCMHAYMYVCMYVCTYVRMYVCI